MAVGMSAGLWEWQWECEPDSEPDSGNVSGNVGQTVGMSVGMSAVQWEWQWECRPDSGNVSGNVSRTVRMSAGQWECQWECQPDSENVGRTVGMSAGQWECQWECQPDSGNGGGNVSQTVGMAVGISCPESLGSSSTVCVWSAGSSLSCVLQLPSGQSGQPSCRAAHWAVSGWGDGRVDLPLALTLSLSLSPAASLSAHSSVRQRQVEVQHTAPSQRELNHSDQESCLSLGSEPPRPPASSPHTHSSGHRSLPSRPCSLLKLTEELTPTHSTASDSNTPTPNGSSQAGDSLGSMYSESVADTPPAARKPPAARGLEKSASLSEIHRGNEGSAISPSESSRSLSPTSTEPEAAAAAAGTGQPQPRDGGSKTTKIPQLATKKSPMEEDSTSTGEDTEPNPGKKKPGFKLFKKKVK
ncbi:stromal interaction molecule 1-like [Amblyraja radiata]|uniref:stromal interaction molecule 1-like n=1 Tax=Amblyraja radiata TaxID=386614 RepID=UPI0014021180|nr:stromal interaction molecule 1-like [Amblyraja radiata]